MDCAALADDEYVPLDREAYRALTARLVHAMPGPAERHVRFLVPGNHALNDLSYPEGRSKFVTEVANFARLLTNRM